MRAWIGSQRWNNINSKIICRGRKRHERYSIISPDLTEVQIREKIRAPFRSRKVEKEITDADILRALKTRRTAQDHAKHLNISVTDFVRKADKLKVDGYAVSELGDTIWIDTAIAQNLEPETLNVDWKGNKIIRLGLISDTHFNSKYIQLSYLHDFYDICKHEGIKHIYHAGDIDEGEQMRVGHQYECYTQGADEHVDEIVRIYPNNGIQTHFITGNHDASIIKRCGYNIGRSISSQRSDMHYLGQDCAIIKLTPNCTMELRHPWGGSSYAISYKPQKMIDAMQGGDKPNILAIGHFHKLEYLFYRNVHCFQVGTFQGQTPFTKGQGLSVHMGGWIVEIHVDDNGYIQRIKPEMAPYYYTKADDYKEWR